MFLKRLARGKFRLTIQIKGDSRAYLAKRTKPATSFCVPRSLQKGLDSSGRKARVFHRSTAADKCSGHGHRRSNRGHHLSASSFTWPAADLVDNDLFHNAQPTYEADSFGGGADRPL